MPSGLRTVFMRVRVTSSVSSASAAPLPSAAGVPSASLAPGAAPFAGSPSPSASCAGAGMSEQSLSPTLSP